MLFKSHLRPYSTHPFNCKVGRDQIRIRGRESLGIFSGVGPKRGDSVTLSTEGEDSFNISFV